jgi:hypothetical protein
MTHTSKQSSGNQHISESKEKPDYLKRFAGSLLIIMGSIGAIVTIPLSFLGGIIGLLRGIITKKDPLKSISKGIKIGSLGFIYIIEQGIKLLKARVETQDKQKKAQIHETQPEESSKDIPQESEIKNPKETFRKPSNSFFKSAQVSKSKKQKADQPSNFNNPKTVQALIGKANNLAAQEEAAIKLEQEELVSKVDEQFIEELRSLIKNPAASEQEFWNKLEQMGNKDIKLFVNKLSSTKKGKYGSSELDYLWRHFKRSELEPLKKENKKNKLIQILKVLSEEQLKASFDSADFLNCLNQDVYVEAAANTLDRKQLEWFASNSDRHEALSKMIKKLAPDAYLLGKLVSIIPHASKTLHLPLVDQLSHLPHVPQEPNFVSFKLDLTKLSEHYIGINEQINKHSKTPEKQKASQPPPSKWKKVKADFNPVYAQSKVNKVKDWTDEDFELFLRELNTSAFIKQEKLQEDLNSLPDHRIGMIAERASSDQFKNLLNHFWIIESKTINSGIEIRKNRLKIILEHLSESQLKSSLKENKFWEIFRNTQDGYCDVAAAVLSPKQFEIIISNSPLERHSDFSILIAHLKKENATDKKRFQEIMEKIIPYTTPWFVLALEFQIRTLLVSDKQLFERLNADLKKYLGNSLEKNEIKLRYMGDKSLNKVAIESLLSTALLESSTIKPSM